MELTDYTCGACGTEFRTNCSPGDIACPECEAHMCSNCGHWDERPA